jgi:hypothetical protein
LRSSQRTHSSISTLAAFHASHLHVHDIYERGLRTSDLKARGMQRAGLFVVRDWTHDLLRLLSDFVPISVSILQKLIQLCTDRGVCSFTLEFG